MFENIVSCGINNKVVQGKLMNFDVNELLIELDDGDTSDISKLEDLDNIILNVRLKRSNTDLIANSLRFSDVFKISNAFGGYAFNKDNNHHTARLVVGNIILEDKDVLEVELQNTLSGEDLDIKVSAIDNEDTEEVIRSYEGLNTGGDSQSIKDCMTVLSMEEYEGSASINDGENSYQINSREAVNIANADFQLEEYVEDIGLVYRDPSGNGRDITAKLPTARYVAVTEVY